MTMTPEELAAQEAKAKADAEAKKTANAEELLKSLKLKDSEIEALKGNENLLNVITHSLDAKRGANAEAKEYREKLEALQADAEAKEKEKLEKKGEYEKLYNEVNEKLTTKDKKIKEALVKGELSRLAGQLGLAKAEYLKLLDTSSIEVDLDNLEVNGAEDVFNSFKENNPELFSKSVPGTDSGQHKINKVAVGDVEKLNQLKVRATNSGMPRDLAEYKSLKRELEKKGLI